MNIQSSALVESKTIRDQSLLQVGASDSQKALLSKVKSLFFSVWDGTEWITRESLASFYEVSVETIDSNYQRNKDELDLDGVKVLRGKDLSHAKRILRLASKAAQVTIYTPAGALRMGFILRDSDVAKNVRTASIRLIQTAGDLVRPEVLDAIITGLPVLSSTVRQGHLEVASPFEAFYREIQRKLKKRFPNGGIPGFTKDDIREKLAALSTHTKNLKFDSQKQLNFPVGSGERSKYPDLVSMPFEVVIDGQGKTVVFMLQISNMMTDFNDVQEALCRRYIEVAKDHYQSDYAFLFLVSPFGATPEAKAHIENTIPDGVKGSIGVMTVKQVAELLRDQAFRERDLAPLKGKINQEFASILEYEIPQDPYFEGDVIQASLLNLLP